MRQREASVPLADGGEVGVQVGQDEVDYLALTLNAALHGNHARSEINATLAFVERGLDHTVRTTVSSSTVMNMTPLADPDF